VNILVLGPQGSGKGTQAKKIAKTYGVPHISTGDMLREMRQLDTPLGRQLKAVLDSGELVNDELMVDLIRDRLSRGDTVPGFILDGFPRTMAQAEALDDLLRDVDKSIDVVFEFQIAHRQELIDRMLKRAEIEGRADDTLESIERRLALYDRETAPLVEFYRSRHGNVVGIHADRTIDEVFHEIQASLSSVEARA
jgi:adenylate kinase